MKTISCPDFFSGEAWGNDKALNESNPCVICGKNCRDDAPMLIVMGGGASALAASEDETEAAEDPGYMGSYAIGPDCLRKRPPLKEALR